MQFSSANLILDFISTFAFALVGAQMAMKKEMDIAGVDLSLHYHAQFLAAIVLGVISGVLGGLVRDVLCQTPPVLLHRETNGSSSFLGALLFGILVRSGLNNSISQIICLLVVVFLRLISIKKGWNLPKFNFGHKK